ncbi:MAG: WD40 repeat domain-containing protein [Oscillatoriales cyanobacterium SM2_2_1]|nr:WD40 repeat domain-containing protein [Oscillatoriales cyanobacterium SM2_2_1]
MDTGFAQQNIRRLASAGFGIAMAGLALLAPIPHIRASLGRNAQITPPSIAATKQAQMPELPTVKLSGGRVVQRTALSRDGRFLAAAGTGIKIWNIARAQWNPIGSGWVETLNRSSEPTGEISFSPDGRVLAAASGRMVKLWRTADGTLLRSLEGHDSRVTRITHSPDGRVLASASTDGTIRLWLANGGSLRTLKGHSAPVLALAYAPDGRTLASTAADGTARIWTFDGRPLRTLKRNSRSSRPFYSRLAFSPDGRVLADSDGSSITLWRTNGKPIRTLPGHPEMIGKRQSPGIVHHIAFSPDGRFLASCGDDGTVKLWRTADGQLLNTLQGKGGVAMHLAFSPDGRFLASGHGAKVRLWLPNGQLFRTLEGQSDIVRHLVFSADGRILSTSAGQVVLWRLDALR